MHHTLSAMSSTTNAITAKLTERANAHKQLKECRRQLEEDAEQERLEEERLAKELEKMRVEEERKVEEKREAKRWAEEWRKQEEEEARATKAFAQKEAELLKKQLVEAKKKKDLKRSRPELEMEVEVELEKEEEQTGESAMVDRKIVWRMRARWICGECWKGDRKCLWPEASSWTKACHSCGALKVKCVMAGEESSEAGPLKKRKVAADKGKGKAKEVKVMKSEPEFGFRELVEELRGLRQDLREFRTDLRSTRCNFSIRRGILRTAWRIWQGISCHIRRRRRKKRGVPGTPEIRRMRRRRLCNRVF